VDEALWQGPSGVDSRRGLTLLGFNPDGSPIVVVVETGPGLVQTPHMENSYGIITPPGVAVQACRGNGGGEA
jgi:hypothetical protein